MNGSIKRKKSVRKLIALVAVVLCVAFVVSALPVDNAIYVNAESTFSTTKKTVLSGLRKLYEKYNKKYYSEKEYKKLTDLYNKADRWRETDQGRNRFDDRKGLQLYSA